MAESTNPHTGKLILLIDDDEDFQIQMRLYLESEGYQVVEAASRSEAETLIETTRPDLAIVDLMMEEFDSGFVLCYHIKNKYPDVPIILATNVAGETGFEFDVATGEEQSWVRADVVLNKPIRYEQLEREMNRLLDR